jgi:ElaB/YqjD/DUF883 family membrane-anchored ribosome-binding protein
MNTQTAANTARQTSDELLQTAEKAVDTTRSYANERPRQGRKQGARPARQRRPRGRHAGRPRRSTWPARAWTSRLEAKERAQRSLTNASAATSRYVADQPLRSVLIAAAVGAGVALLISSARHRSQNRY